MKKFKQYSDSLQPFFEAVGRLSKIQRGLIVAAVFALLIGGFVFFSYMPKFQELKATNQKYERVMRELNTAKRKAAELDGLKKEWGRKQEEFKLVMDALPDKQEIPSLLADISKAGRNAGLDFQQFSPKNEISKNFYAEIPVSIKVDGSFFSVFSFFKQVSEMARIVNLRDIKMKNSDKKNFISVKCTAVTYRFISTDNKGQKNT